MESDLRVALECNEFEVHYQPIVEPCSGFPIGAEALIRWRHPVRGNVPPLEFIPVAEESGLITSIGNWVFEEAVNQMAEWDRHADTPHLDLLSVNFSARQLEDVAGARRLGQILRLCAIDASRVDIEVTESVAMADRATTRASLQALEGLGLRVSIDDFGTGFSSLSHLHTLPVATVKIDRMFIERLDVSEGSTPVVKAILDMSHAMGLRVIAEGVSSAPLREIVADMGCDLAQGFYWSQALPANEFAQWWTRAILEATARREAQAAQLLVGS
jgi:EAL domain-containing protein (putative c-di-GMP-specific phosphodiesterase class I)